MKIGFIGCGNMAGAIIKGLISSGNFSGGDIALFDVDKNKPEKLKDEYGCDVCSSAGEVAKTCENVVLAVKPNVISSVLTEINDVLEENDPLIISIAAGKTLEFIGECLSYEPRLIRVMPNINAQTLAAVSAFCPNTRAENGRDFAEKFCKSFGSAVELEEKYFPVFGVIGGCSPAFAYMFIDALARAAVKNGMPKSTALEISAQAVLGSAKMILASDECPWALVDKVCSPGGTTIEGVLSLQENGFEAAVAKAVQAAVDKDSKI